MTKFKAYLATSAAMLSGGLAIQPAGAQTSPSSQQTPAQPATPVAPDAGQGQARAQAEARGPARAGPDDQLQEIVVTAQKVENNVQRVPVAIQAISGDALLKSGIQSAQDLQRFVPGLLVTATGAGGSSFYIRGVGTFNESPTTDAGLAVSLDQMYFSRAYGPDLALYDLERIEVLKGPQGTLYGRNATGGTINIVSRKPRLNETSGDLAVEGGDYDAIKINGGINLAIGPTLALRAAGQYNKHDGYYRDGYDDADTRAARVHLLWEPSSDFNILLSGDYMRNDSNGPGITPFPDHQFVTADPYDGGGSAAARAYVIARNPGPAVGFPSNLQYVAGGCLPGCLPPNYAPVVTPGPWQVDRNGYVDVKVRSLKAAVNWNVGFATLTVIPTYLETDFRDKYFKGSTPVANVSSVDQKTLEVRLASPAGGRFTWILGGFYFDEDQSYITANAAVSPNAVIYGANPDYSTKSKAAFAQATFEVIPDVKVTGGIRYTTDDKKSLNSFTEVATYRPGPPASRTAIARSTIGSSATTYRVGLDWQARPTNLLYGYVATGFHAGGFNVGLPATRRLCTPNTTAATLADFANCDARFEYDPEKLTAYAIGSKNRFLDNSLQLNIEAYYWKYKDLQVNHLGLTNPSQTALRTDNAGSAEIKGVDVELSWLVGRDDLLTVNANYNDSSYGNFIFYNVTVGRSVTTSNLTGKSFLNAPRFVTSFAYEHTFHLGNGGTIVPSINGKYQSRIVFGYLPAGQTTDVYQGRYAKFDLNLTYNSPSRDFSVSGFVRNVGDKAVLLSASGGNTPGTNSPWASLAPPRTYGVSVRSRF